MVRAKTCTSGCLVLTRWVASMPPIPGMLMSMITTCGRREATRSRACWPSPASPTTSMSCSRARIIRTPSRTMAWSSATTTLILAIHAHLDRDHRLHPRAPTFPGLHPECAAEQFGAFPHPQQPHPALAPGGDVREVEAAAVVRDRHPHVLRGDRDLDPRAMGLSVFQDVRDGLLHDAEHRGFDVMGQAFVGAGDAHRHVQPLWLDVLLDVPAHGRGEAE